MNPTQFFAPEVWLNGAWAQNVLLTVDRHGRWSRITPGCTPGQHPDAPPLKGPVLPGLVNAHSHAFQRAMAGLAEQRAPSASCLADDFWSWRARMYAVAQRITPEQLEAIATFLYAELLAGGYTQVCEFHYLHHAPDGAPPADPLAMSMALVRAAQQVGIGLTLLPTLYLRSGFAAQGLRDDQRRFASTPEQVWRLVEAVQRQSASLAQINVGVAIHSLRAADAGAVRELAQEANARGLPVHIHVAEQLQEVQDCLAHTGQRPMEWLLANVPVNAHWNLVHATRTTAAELQGVQRCGAAIVICPSTEANLGDGVFDYPAYAGLGGTWSIGSDSHVTRSWVEELRLLEYAQRLTLRQRNVAAHTGSHTSSAAALFEAALVGGAPATAQLLGGVAVGQRADFLVLDAASPALLGVPAGQRLDALVFSSPQALFPEVFVAGQPVLHNGQTVPTADGSGNWVQIQHNYLRAMTQLWG